MVVNPNKHASGIDAQVFQAAVDVSRIRVPTVALKLELRFIQKQKQVNLTKAKKIL